MEFDDIKKECKKIERHFIAQEAERDTLLALLIEQETTLKNLETQKDNNKKGLIFLRTKAAETRTNALAAIEEIIGAGIQNIYGHDYKFTLELKELSTKDSENGGQFTILPCIEKTINGKRVKRPVKGSNGGGLIEIISLLLRFAFGTFNNYDGIYVIDEALSAVSNDDVMKKLLNYLDEYIKNLNQQIALVSHSPEKYSQISNINYLVYKQNGIAQVKQITRDDIIDLQNFDVSE